MLEDWNSQLIDTGEGATQREALAGGTAAPASDLFGIDHRAEFLARWAMAVLASV